jgi:Flp pilus assembly protein TadG
MEKATTIAASRSTSPFDSPREAPGQKRQRGATLVEFAIIAPILFALLFGIIDFAWMLGQHQDVRHGAREGARLAAVNTDTAANMTTAVQNAMNIANGGTVTFVDGSTGCAGTIGRVTVTVAVTSLTGFSRLPFLSALYPTSFTSSVDFMLDQDSTSWGANNCP